MRSASIEPEKRALRPLFEAGKLRCPHDKQLHDLLTYKRFDLPDEFATQLNVVLRCLYCSHVFSPHLDDQEMKLIQESF